MAQILSHIPLSMTLLLVMKDLLSPRFNYFCDMLACIELRWTLSNIYQDLIPGCYSEDQKGVFVFIDLPLFFLFFILQSLLSFSKLLQFLKKVVYDIHIKQTQRGFWVIRTKVSCFMRFFRLYDVQKTSQVLDQCIH